MKILEKKNKNSIKVVTICGSARFEDDMIKIARDLEFEKGYCVLQCIYGVDVHSITQKQFEKMEDAHYKKIDISDAVFIVNKNGYIGESTRNEINYAKKLGKEIIYLENTR